MALDANFLAQTMQQQYAACGWNLARASALSDLCEILASGIVTTLQNRAHVKITTTVISGLAGPSGMAQGILMLTMPQPVWEQNFFGELSAQGWKGKNTLDLVRGLSKAVSLVLATVQIMAGPIVGVGSGMGQSTISLNAQGMKSALEQNFFSKKWQKSDKNGTMLPELTDAAATLARVAANQMTILLASCQTMIAIAGIPFTPTSSVSGMVDFSGYLQ